MIRMNNRIIDILNNNELSKEEKTNLLKELANKLKDTKEKGFNSSYDNYSDGQKKVVEKAREAAKENRLKIKQINYDSEIKEKMEILSYLKNDMGDKRFSKEYLDSLSGTEILSIYDDYDLNMKDILEKAKEERLKDINKNDEVLEKTNNDTEDTNETLGDTPKRKEMPKLKDNLDRITKDELTGDVIVKEEDGSRFTKVKGFFRRHMKKVIKAGAVFGALGGLALAYYLLKQGDADSAQNVVETISNVSKDVSDTASDIANNVDMDINSYDDLASKTDVGTVDTTYYTNDDAISGNGLTPNEYHGNNILGAVDSSNNRYPAESMKDIYDLVDSGKDITSLEVGGYNPASGETEIDGHVTEVYGKNLQNIFDGRKM